MAAALGRGFLTLFAVVETLWQAQVIAAPIPNPAGSIQKARSGLAGRAGRNLDPGANAGIANEVSPG